MCVACVHLVCVHEHVCVHVCFGMCVLTRGGQMLKSSVFLYSSPPDLFLKIGLLTKSLMWQDQQVGNFIYLPSLH